MTPEEIKSIEDRAKTVAEYRVQPQTTNEALALQSAGIAARDCLKLVAEVRRLRGKFSGKDQAILHTIHACIEKLKEMGRENPSREKRWREIEAASYLEPDYDIFFKVAIRRHTPEDLDE